MSLVSGKADEAVHIALWMSIGNSTTLPTPRLPLTDPRSMITTYTTRKASAKLAGQGNQTLFLGSEASLTQQKRLI